MSKTMAEAMQDLRDQLMHLRRVVLNALRPLFNRKGKT